MPPPTDRVRARTAPDVLRRLDDATTAELARAAVDGPPAIARRLRRLDREWDTDRVLEAETAATGLVGLSLGLLVHRGLLALSVVAAGSLLLHALTGRHPWLPLLRRLSVRSPREVERERYALKALRGDFAGLGAAVAPGTSDEEPDLDPDRPLSPGTTGTTGSLPLRRPAGAVAAPR